MKTIRTALGRRLSDEAHDARLGQLACYLGAVAVVPTSIVALVKHPGSPADLFFGLVLAGLVGLLCVALGTLCRRVVGSREGMSPWSRWPEFATYPACIGVLVLGIRGLAGLELTPARVTVGLLLTCSLSLAVLMLGMMTTPVRSSKG